MKGPFRHHSAPASASPPSSSDLLDQEVWRRVGAILDAGNRSDSGELSRLWQSLDDDVSDHQRGLAGVYIWYLLQYRVLEILERRPSSQDLHELTNRIYPKFAKLIQQDQARLEDTLCTVFEHATPERQVVGGELLVSGSAIVSILLDDPASQMEIIRPALERWYNQNAQKLQDLGVT